MNGNAEPKKIVIVGGGLVGALNAIYMARNSRFDIYIYEKRQDIRLEKHIAGRSINLSLSHRGICALREVGLDKEVLQHGIPMYGRMIHRLNGKKLKSLYGQNSEALISVDRRLLNEILLSSAEKFPNVTIKFNCKLANVELKKKTANFQEYGGAQFNVRYDLLMGNDGAFSRVRHAMTSQTVFNYSQEYIPHGYLELYFPASEKGEYTMEKNFLHIWPRNEFMLIGLPNPEGSFTGTLFMPLELFARTQSSEDILVFFKQNFPDAIKLMGEQLIVEKYSSRKPSSMISIKCNPYNYEESCILMGDSAHAMVPFYGQGMNCGFEDVLLFHNILKENDYKIEGCCSKFSEARHEDAKAMCDLAFYNYVEMRKHLNSSLFFVRKWIDQFLFKLFPTLWMPLYTMVTFTRMSYRECMLRKKSQDKTIRFVNRCWLVLLASGVFMGTLKISFVLFNKR